MTSMNTAGATGETLLIVEDDILPAICLKEGLEEAGFDVLDLTAHVAEAIAAALTAKPAPPVSRPACRQIATKAAQAARSASPLSRRKSAMVLKSGASLPNSHISSVLRRASRSSRRLDCTWLRQP